MNLLDLLEKKSKNCVWLVYSLNILFTILFTYKENNYILITVRKNGIIYMHKESLKITRGSYN